MRFSTLFLKYGKFVVDDEGTGFDSESAKRCFGGYLAAM
jgi:hypothetical protein